MRTDQPGEGGALPGEEGQPMELCSCSVLCMYLCMCVYMQDMLAVDVSSENCRSVMDRILMAAKPYVQAYLKHTWTGNNLTLACNLTQTEISVCACVWINYVTSRGSVPRSARTRRRIRRPRTHRLRVRSELRKSQLREPGLALVGCDAHAWHQM